MKLFALTLAFALFGSTFALATEIEQAQYDSTSKTLTLSLVYQGGNQSHNYSLEWDSCQSTPQGQEIAARLIDSGWEDTGTQESRDVVRFYLGNLDCRPALLTVRSGRFSHRTVWID